jgi:hypothetical protein
MSASCSGFGAGRCYVIFKKSAYLQIVEISGDNPHHGNQSLFFPKIRGTWSVPPVELRNTPTKAAISRKAAASFISTSKVAESKNRRARKSSCVNLSRTTRPRSKNTQRDRKRDHAMLDIVKTDEEVLAFDVSDEALEIAAGAVSDKAKYTLGACTGLSVCPG